MLPGTIPIERGKQQVHRGESDAVEHHEFTDLLPALEIILAETHDGVGEKCEQKLERIDVEQDDEKQAAIEKDGAEIVSAEAAEESIVRVPDHHEEEETDGEGQKAAHAVMQLGIGFGNLQRDDEQGEREAEHDIGKTVDAGHLRATEAEAVFLNMLLKGKAHGCFEAIAR